MASEHPHANATYRILERDQSFSAEVTIPGMMPIIISGFASKELAEAWIVKHQREIADYPGARSRWRGRQAKRDE
jgi:hypothetical protein